MAVHKKIRSEIGAALVELGFMSALLIVLVGGVIDMSAGISALNEMTNAARDGARLASLTGGITANNGTVIQATETKLQNINTLSDIIATNTDPIAGPTLNSLGQPCNFRITVTVTANYNPFFVGKFGFNTIPLRRNASMRWNNGVLCN